MILFQPVATACCNCLRARLCDVDDSWYNKFYIILCRYSEGGRGMAYCAGNKSTFTNYCYMGPMISHSIDVVSYGIKSTNKANIPSVLFKACLYVLCHDLVPLREVQSAGDFTVLPATDFSDMDNSALLTLKEKSSSLVKGSPVFTVNSPGVCEVTLVVFASQVVYVPIVDRCLTLSLLQTRCSSYWIGSRTISSIPGTGSRLVGKPGRLILSLCRVQPEAATMSMLTILQQLK